MPKSKASERRAFICRHLLTGKNEVDIRYLYAKQFPDSQSCTTDLNEVHAMLGEAASIDEVKRAHSISVAMAGNRIARYDETYHQLIEQVTRRTDIENRYLDTLDKLDRSRKPERQEKLEKQAKSLKRRLDVIPPLGQLFSLIAITLDRQSREHLKQDKRLRLDLANEPWQMRIAGLLEDGVCPPELAQLLVQSIESFSQRILTVTVNKDETSESQ